MAKLVSLKALFAEEDLKALCSAITEELPESTEKKSLLALVNSAVGAYNSTELTAEDQQAKADLEEERSGILASFESRRVEAYHNVYLANKPEEVVTLADLTADENARSSYRAVCDGIAEEERSATAEVDAKLAKLADPKLAAAMAALIKATDYDPTESITEKDKGVEYPYTSASLKTGAYTPLVVTKGEKAKYPTFYTNTPQGIIVKFTLEEEVSSATKENSVCYHLNSPSAGNDLADRVAYVNGVAKNNNWQRGIGFNGRSSGVPEWFTEESAKSAVSVSEYLKQTAKATAKVVKK